MKQDIVVTNLRIPKTDWLQIRALAAEVGMSVNEYINFLIKDISLKKELAQEVKKKVTDLPIWELDKIVTAKGKGLTKEDEVIYGK
ncbi:MAG: hypothetical protein ACPLXP_01505 [Microgenomates group bacterium]